MLSAPSSISWPRFRTKPTSTSSISNNPRTITAFWIFGLTNNILYVLILTAALDLVGPLTPKASVLLASIIPSLITKLLLPYFLHRIPYNARILLCAVLSTAGMLAVALSPTPANDPDDPNNDNAHEYEYSGIPAKLAGIILANISSAAGEMNFLSLTHFFGPLSLAAWGSGTGAAGLVGAGAYALATNELGFSVQATLLASAVVPALMVGAWVAVLPRGMLGKKVPRQDGVGGGSERDGVDDEDWEAGGVLGENDAGRERAGLLAHQPDNVDESEGEEASSSPPIFSHHRTSHTKRQLFLSDLRSKLRRSRSLLLPYMLPLFLVYLAEYTINQGVAPTLLFPLPSAPFSHYREFYPAYGALYQAGVFISRSSLALFQVRSLYIPSFLQLLNLVILTLHAIHPFIPSVYIIFPIILWEGLLGGLVYVSTYARVRDEVPPTDAEFSLAAVSVSDAAGICLAGFLGVGLEGAICARQVRAGRDWCRRL